MSQITAESIGLSREEFKLLHAALHNPEDSMRSAMTSNGARSVIYGLRSAIEEVIAARMNIASAAAWDACAEESVLCECALGPHVEHSANPYRADSTQTSGHTSPAAGGTPEAAARKGSQPAVSGTHLGT